MVIPSNIAMLNKDRRQAEIDELVEKMNDRIASVNANNHHFCEFIVPRYHVYYPEVKKLFEDAGFRIQETGWLYGAWHTEESIYW